MLQSKKLISQATYFISYLDRERKTWIDVLLYKDWTQLKQLYLFDCEISDAETSILSSAKWPKLLVLSLCKSAQNKITASGIKQFVKNEWPQLQELHLSNNNIESEGFEILMARQLPLQRIFLQYNNISFKGFKSLPNCKNTHLKQLNLSGNNIGNNGIKYLAKTQLPELRFLCLNKCHIGSQGARQITKTKLPNLHFLRIDQNQIIDKTLDLNFNNWKFLKSIDLSGISVISTLTFLTSKINIQLNFGMTFVKKEFKKDIKAIYQSKFSK